MSTAHKAMRIAEFAGLENDGLVAATPAGQLSPATTVL